MKLGVTGHQQLQDPDWVRQRIDRIICLQAQPLVGITSLAIGSDQIFAQEILKYHGSLHIVVPTEHYCRTFDPVALIEYQRLLGLASMIEVLPDGSSDEIAYLSAGKLVVDRSDLLIAIWDGKPAAGLGGTGDVVKYAKSQGQRFLHINPATKIVKWC